MYYLIDNEQIDSNEIALNIHSLFLHTAQGLCISMLYNNQVILWFEEHIKQLQTDAKRQGFDIDLEKINYEKIIQLLEKNKLLDKTALIKILCIKQIFNCSIIILTYPYKLSIENTKAIVHSESFLSNYDRMHNLNLAREIFWLEFYKKKFGVDQILFINNKKRIIQGFNANIIALWNKNLYYVHPTQNYKPYIIQKKLLKNAKKLGIKKVLDKGKGLSFKLLEQADEVILLNDIFLARTIEKIYKPSGSFILTSQKALKKTNNTFAKLIHDFFLK